jgi:hypothetical protein
MTSFACCWGLKIVNLLQRISHSQVSNRQG